MNDGSNDNNNHDNDGNDNVNHDNGSNNDHCDKNYDNTNDGYGDQSITIFHIIYFRESFISKKPHFFVFLFKRKNAFEEI